MAKSGAVHKAESNRSQDGKLRVDPDFAEARTQESLKRTERIEQIIKKEAGELVSIEEIRIASGTLGSSLRERLLAGKRQVRANFPELPEEVIEFIDAMIRDVLSLVSEDLRSAAKKLTEADPK